MTDSNDDILADLDPVLLSKKLRISFGKNQRDMSFITQNLTLGQLIKQDFAGFQRGPKDGRCLLSGECVGGQRNTKSIKTNHLVMIDVDNGESPASIYDKIEARGLFAIVYTTHSHLKTVTEFNEDKIVRWAMKRDIDLYACADDELEQLAYDYMREETKYAKAIWSSVTSARLGFDETGGGKKFFVTHGPMPRVRALFVLDEPYSFEAGNQTARIAEWKERVAGFATDLGLVYDTNSTDVARLMFTPRFGDNGVAAWELEEKGLVADASGNFAYDNDGEDGQKIHHIYYVKGRALALDDMPRLDPKKQTSAEEDAFAAAAAEVGVNTRERKTYATLGMAKFMAQYSSVFSPTLMFEAFDVQPRNVSGSHHTYECPGDENHSNAGDIADHGFFCVDAENRESGFSMLCSHDSCKTLYSDDRSLFLDKACVNFGITDARELLHFCPGHEYDNIEDEIAEEIAAEPDGLEKLVEVLTEKSDAKTIQKALKTLVKSNLAPLDVDRVLADVVKKTKRTKKTVADTYREMKREEDVATSEVNNVVVETRPVPHGVEAERANIIWTDWSYPDQMRVAVTAFAAKNAKEPRVFARSEGGTVRLTTLGTEKRLEELVTKDAWTFEIDQHLLFKEASTEDDPEHYIGASPAIVSRFVGSNELGLPMIERVVNVPVFGYDGTLQTTKGYHEASQAYLNPNIEYRAVDDLVTDDNLSEALYWLTEAVRDFPFSDSFTGSDHLPVRVEGEVDDDGHPMANWERGKSSRTNLFAMLLQPFVRAMIDGPCPAYLLDKSMPGTGAGFLADVAGYIMYGHRMTPQTVAEDKEEFRKEITATLREGASTIFLDNINHKMDHGPFASALTSGNWKGRLLGQSANIDVPVRATWILAANSGRFSEELMRRIVPIRMDAATPNPSRDRPVSWYKHKDLHGWLDDHRADLVWACHVLVKNWIQQGAPDGAAMLQSFNSWAGVMSGILECAGLEGFLENIPAYLENRTDDDDTENVFEFITRLHHYVKEGGTFTVEEAELAAGDEMNPDKVAASLNIQQKPGQPLRRAIGYFMRRIIGKTYKWQSGKLVTFERAGMSTSSNTTIYRMVIVSGN